MRTICTLAASAILGLWLGTGVATAAPQGEQATPVSYGALDRFEQQVFTLLDKKTIRISARPPGAIGLEAWVPVTHSTSNLSLQARYLPLACEATDLAANR